MGFIFGSFLYKTNQLMYIKEPLNMMRKLQNKTKKRHTTHQKPAHPKVKAEAKDVLSQAYIGTSSMFSSGKELDGTSNPFELSYWRILSFPSLVP